MYLIYLLDKRIECEEGMDNNEKTMKLWNNIIKNSRNYLLSWSVHFKAYKMLYCSLCGLILLVVSIYFLVYAINTVFHEKTNDDAAFCTAIATLGSFVAILSIILTIATLKKTQSLFEAQMLNEYDDKYGSEEMCNDLRTLINFSRKEENKNIFIEKRNPKNNPRKRIIFFPNDNFMWPKSVDLARRRVKFYFINPYDLYMEGKISKSIFLRIINKTGITVFFDVVEKLEYLLNPKYDHEKFYNIMLLGKNIYKKQKKSDQQMREHPLPKRVFEN